MTATAWCAHGHPLTADNTYYADDQLRCITCRLAATRREQAAARVDAAPTDITVDPSEGNPRLTVRLRALTRVGVLAYVNGVLAREMRPGRD